MKLRYQPRIRREQERFFGRLVSAVALVTLLATSMAAGALEGSHHNLASQSPIDHSGLDTDLSVIHGEEMAVAAAPAVNVGMAGFSAVALERGLLAMAISEREEGADLNGDGDTDDLVPHIFDPATGTTTNVGIAGSLSMVALEGGLLAFPADEAAHGTDLNGDGDTDDLVPHIFDPATGTAINTGVASVDFSAGSSTSPAIGVALDGGGLAFPAEEKDHGADLNGDGDLEDFVPHIFVPATGTTNVGIAGFTMVALDGGGLGFAAAEDREGVDLNGDGDTLDFVPHVFDPATATVANTGIAEMGDSLLPLVGGFLSFDAVEAEQGADLNDDGDVLDLVPHVFNPATATVTNVAIAGEVRAALPGGELAFFASEFNEGADLNDDGDIGPFEGVPHVFDPASGKTTNIGIAAAIHFGELEGGELVFNADEAGEGADLNGDGDTDDGVLHLYTPATGAVTNVGIAGAGGGFYLTALDGGRLAFLVSEPGEGVDLNGDGDADDPVPHVFDLATGALRNVGIAGSLGALVALDGGGLAFGAGEDGEGISLNRDDDVEDIVPHVFDPDTDSVTNIGRAASRLVALDGGGLAFDVSEEGELADELVYDLNGDGDGDDRVPHVWGYGADTSSGTFIDDDDSIFEADIEWLAETGITKGCNPPVNDRFCPDDFVTRGQMAAFLVRGLGYTDDGGGDLFIDDDGSTFEADIDRLGTAGVTKGCNPPVNDRFCPDDFVTRGQMAAFLVRALGYTDNGGGDLFIDDDGSTFENDIDKLGTAGVTKGCNPPTNDEFCPDDLVTRGQMAAFLHRALGP